MAESITAKLLTFFLGSNGRNQLQPGEWELVGTRILGDEDFEDVPPWVRKEIDRICAKGLGTTPDELTHFRRGKTFLYRLDFDGQGGDIVESIVPEKRTHVCRMPRNPWGNELAAAATPRPRYTGTRIPGRWSGRAATANQTSVRYRLGYGRRSATYQHGPGSSLGGLTYYLKGKRYRYKLVFAGQGGPIVNVYRKPRTWWWKKQLK